MHSLHSGWFSCIYFHFLYRYIIYHSDISVISFPRYIRVIYLWSPYLRYMRAPLTLPCIWVIGVQYILTYQKKIPAGPRVELVGHLLVSTNTQQGGGWWQYCTLLWSTYLQGFQLRGDSSTMEVITWVFQKIEKCCTWATTHHYFDIYLKKFGILWARIRERQPFS